jgi:ubiquinone/menaquinone biosynthesis C-methylase UbiE
MGFYPVVDSPYDQDYWDKYVGYANSQMGKELTLKRVEWVNKWADGMSVIDVGIGCGHFIQERKHPTYGYDINPVAVEWLESRGLLVDPNASQIDALTFWDVIEHIKNPESMLANAKRFVFASIPVFTGPEQILTSKHFRKDEHCWYWTRESFPVFMSWFGFRLLEVSNFESELGREDIATFAFERV